MKEIPSKASLPELVLKRLRAGIKSGEWRDRLPSERDLSKAFQVSRPTLRLALEQLKQEGWIRVEGRRTLIVKRRRWNSSLDQDTMRTRTIVFLSPVPLEELPATALLLYSELGQRLALLGATIQIAVSPVMMKGKVEGFLDRLTARVKADAWVLFRAPAEVQRYFANRAMPVVIFGNAHEGIEIPALEIDYGAGLRHCMAKLLRLGHEAGRIALFLPETDLAGHREIERVFRSHTGIGERRQIFRHHENGENIAALFVRAGRALPGFTAVVVLRTSAAVTIHGMVSRLGGQIPRDMSLACLEDAPIMAHMVPELARYHVDNSRVVQMVFSTLSRQLSSGIRQSWTHRPLVQDFIAGESMARPPKN